MLTPATGPIELESPATALPPALAKVQASEVAPPYSIGTPVIPPIGPGPEPIVKVTPPLGWQPEAETAREIAALMFDPGGDGGRVRPPSNLPQEHENTKREQDRVTGNREELLVTVEHFIWTVARQMGEEVLQQDAQRLAEVLTEMEPKRSLALAQRLTRLAEIGALTAHDLSFMAQVLSRPGLSAETKARFLELAEISLEQRYAQAAADASLALLTAPLRLLAWADDATSSAWAVEERTLLLDNWLAGLLGVSYTESDDGLALQVSTLAILSMALPPLKGGVSAARGGVGVARGATSTPSIVRGLTGIGDEVARGGVYLLRDPVTGQVMRTGRTNNLARRAGEHARDRALQDYRFDIAFRTDVYAQQRGLEQLVHAAYNPPLNRISPVSMRNPQLDRYLDSAYEFLRIYGGQ